MAKIIETSSGPAILTDAGEVVLPDDLPAVSALLRTEEASEVAELVDALLEKVKEAELLVPKIAKREPLDDAENLVLHLGMKCFMSLFNISATVRSTPVGSDHYEESK